MDFLSHQNSDQGCERATAAALRIQRWYRGRRGVITLQHELCEEIAVFLNAYDLSPTTAVELYLIGQKLLFVSKWKPHKRLFQMFCKAVTKSMEHSSVKVWYVSMALNKTYLVQWIKQVKIVLLKACKEFSVLRPGMPQDDIMLTLYLNIFVTMTDYTIWKLASRGGDGLQRSLHQLCYNLVQHLTENNLFVYLHELLLKGLGCQHPKFNKHTLPASMGIRATAICNFDAKVMQQFVSHVLSTPACLLHLNHLSPETMTQVKKVNILPHCINVLNTMGVPELPPTLLLCLLGNLLELGRLNTDYLLSPNNRRLFLVRLTELLSKCRPAHSSHQSVTSCWHLLFGWCDEQIDGRLMSGLVHVIQQLHFLWERNIVELLFAPVLALSPDAGGEQKSKTLSAIFKKIFSLPTQTLHQSVIDEVYQVTSFYNQCVEVLPQLGSDLLVGLSCANSLLPAKLWYFLHCGCGTDVKTLTQAIICNDRLVSVLSIFCQVMQYLLNVLDDQELLEEKYFPLAKLMDISLLLNNVLYNYIWDQQRTVNNSKACVACCSLLSLLHQRDSRKKFCDHGTWEIKALNPGKFLFELKTHELRALELLQYIPHVIPHRKRVEIFYQRITDDKHSLGIETDRHNTRVPATYITIHRSHILEDGYQQLSSLSPAAVKGTIRVKFINEQGLDEAGIDETGVFKEFLEETIKQAFSPNLNLFKTNSNGSLYPSPTSHVHDNHLQLLEFMGRMLGKAVYEGIVLELPFASFFLSQLARQHHLLHYSSLDELYSMDAELSKSLQFIKHCEDAEDICLTFSFDESFMGKMITYELIPGGSGIVVTNENRINYVHRMALYKMHTQIKEQTTAFLRGFHVIIPPAWLSFFTPHELQKVISGDEVEIDVIDLRNNTVYYGGYHDKHRVIMWLWNILKNEFNSQQKASFLKFVTSCSRPPLLGFSQLDPPFSIRLVDTRDEEDHVTVAGAFRGLLGLGTGAKARLPTASTCFNLLKLPNYQKKSVLKEKLLYAITSNTGFELS